MTDCNISDKSGLVVRIAPYITPLMHSKRQMAARAAVCRLLACMLDVEQISYAYSPSGMPYLPGEGMPHLSISHTEGYVAVALSEHQPIGIDIERIGHQVERVAPRFLSQRELSTLPRELTAQRIAVHLLWSAKEAAYKLINPPSKSLRSFELIDGCYIHPEGEQGSFVLVYNDVDEGAPSQSPTTPQLIAIDCSVQDDYVVALATCMESSA